MKIFRDSDIVEALDFADRQAKILGRRSDRSIRKEVEDKLLKKDLTEIDIKDIVTKKLGIKEAQGSLYTPIKMLIKAHGGDPGSFSRVLKNDIRAAVADSFKDDKKSFKFLARVMSSFAPVE